MNLSRFGTMATASAMVATLLLSGESLSFAGDLKIPIPSRSYSIPVQKLNREGVAELKHGHREKAKRIFYRAYLLDPDDPFTLNNLGYVTELDGDADRALRYYALAARSHTDALIDQSSNSALKHRPLEEALNHVKNSDQDISTINERAIVLLEQGHVFAARNLLQGALEGRPQDPFLLNNLGYAMEAIGDLDGALRCYSAAASVHSRQAVIVTPRLKWRGRPISQVAAGNAAAISQQIAKGEGSEAAAARLNLRGVAALNDNNPSAAKAFFLQAYRDDSRNAFTLNNLGYVAEMSGDRESAEMYYEAARSGRDAKDRVSYATRRDAEGQKIDNLAGENDADVESTLKAVQQAKRRSGRPIELKRRDGVPVSDEKDTTPVPPIDVQSPALPALPLPDSQPNQNTSPDAEPANTPPANAPQQ